MKRKSHNAAVKKLKPKRANPASRSRAAKAAEHAKGLEAEERRLKALADKQEAHAAELRRAAEELANKRSSFWSFFR